MQTIIISIGDELIGGASVDTNSAYLSARLAERGIVAVRHVTVGDDAERITEAIASAAAEAELVIITGGLGPTLNDLTRRALADAMGVELIEDSRSAKRIATFFDRIGRAMKPSNLTQAMIPAGAEAMDNDCGTAPGIAARLGQADVFALPGPPNEMTEMFERQVAPRLGVAGALARRILHVFGTGESDIGERIADLMARDANPKVGTTAKGGIISIRIVATGQTPADTDAAADTTANEIRNRLGDLIFGQGDQTLESVVGDALQACGMTLATAESCTGGMISRMMTETPGSSGYFLGGVIAYANSAKTALLDVPPEIIETHGAVSEQVADAMARGVREKFGADFTLSVTGIAGEKKGSGAFLNLQTPYHKDVVPPDSKRLLTPFSPEKPVGLVYIALSGPDGTKVHRHLFSGARDIIRRRAALTAINYLRLALI